MSFRATIIFTFLYLLTTVSNDVLAEECTDIVGDELSSTTKPLFIGEIRIDSGDLFDPNKPDQRRLVHRLSNSLHIKTQNGTTKAVLPMRTGDVYSDALLVESERVLRSKRYIRDASVKAVQICGSDVIVDVHTIDNWTLTPSISYGRAGGENTYTFELQDLNIFGTGKELKLRDHQSGDLRESTFTYGDDNVLGGRHRVRIELGDNDEGEIHEVQIGLPFYSQNSTHSWQFHVSSESLSYEASNDSEQQIPVLTELAELRYDRRMDHTSTSSFILGGGFRYLPVYCSALVTEPLGKEAELQKHSYQ